VENYSPKNSGDYLMTDCHIEQDDGVGNFPNTVADDSMKGICTHNGINETLVTTMQVPMVIFLLQVA